MGLVYVTGISGVGKSEVCKELTRRGYVAIDADEAGISAWHENASGRCAGIGLPRDVTKTRDWLELHSWTMSRQRLELIAKEGIGESVFICGAARNDQELLDLFTHVVCLYIDNENELRRRLRMRTNNDFGKEPHELEAVLRWKANAKREFENLGATLVNADAPLSKVVDDIIEATHEDEEDR